MPPDISQQMAYSAAACPFDSSFETNLCRKAYDILGWHIVSQLALLPRARVVDAGCGTGRWSARFLKRGHNVTGIENAPGMIQRLHDRAFGPAFILCESDMETARIGDSEADLVIAIGSLQYCDNQARVIRRFFDWLRPGGQVAIMVDLLGALVSECIQKGKAEDALRFLRTRQGSYTMDHVVTPLHLYDRSELCGEFLAAGFEDVACTGLVVSAAALGREGCSIAMRENEAAFLAWDAALAEDPFMADSGLHLMLTARRPG